jgi:hypothetical protein
LPVPIRVGILLLYLRTAILVYTILSTLWREQKHPSLLLAAISLSSVVFLFFG